MTLTHPTTSLDALIGLPFTHERVVITTGIRSGLVITVAVHSTRLGQALGGARLWQYENWTDAVADAPTLFDLRCLVRENLIGWINTHNPEALPVSRTELRRETPRVPAPVRAEPAHPVTAPIGLFSGDENAKARAAEFTATIPVQKGPADER